MSTSLRDDTTPSKGVSRTNPAGDGVRMARQDRRDQLLDAAVSLVIKVGVDSFTMEGLAAEAGISKALPYRHFENARAVLVALYQREMAHLAGSARARVRPGQSRVERAASIVRAYFDAIDARSAVLAVLSAPGSPIPAQADGERRDGVEFVTGLLCEMFGLDSKAARARAAIVLGAFTGAIDAWGHGDAGRRKLEGVAVAVLAAVVGDEPPRS